MQDNDNETAPRRPTPFFGLPPPLPEHIDSASNKDGNTYLHELCRRDGGLALIEEAVRVLGANPDALNADKLPPLALLIEGGRTNAARRLIELGAGFEVETFNAPLFAVAAGQEEVLRMLLEQGAGTLLNRGGILPNKRVSANPAMIVAAEDRKHELLPLLLQAGCFVNARRNIDGMTALHIASLRADVAPVLTLLEAGADADLRDKSGCTPLHIAARAGRADVVAVLLQAGADIAAVSPRGQTPLLLAAENGHLDCIKVLIAAGSDVNHRAMEMEGRTALILAAIATHADIAVELLVAGADPTIADAQGLTAAASVPGGNASFYTVLKAEEEESLRSKFEKAHARELQKAKDARAQKRPAPWDGTP